MDIRSAEPVWCIRSAEPRIGCAAPEATAAMSGRVRTAANRGQTIGAMRKLREMRSRSASAGASIVEAEQGTRPVERWLTGRNR